NPARDDHRCVSEVALSRSIGWSEKRWALPVWQIATTKHDLGGPATEIDREGHAVARICAERNCVRAFRMARECRTPVIGKQNWPAPAVSELHRTKRGMEFANTVFDARKEFGGKSSCNIEGVHVSPMTQMDQTASENDTIAREKSAPQVRQVYGIKRTPRSQAELLDLRVGERRRR